MKRPLTQLLVVAGAAAFSMSAFAAAPVKSDSAVREDQAKTPLMTRATPQAVSEAQQQLKDRGLYNGPVDGKFGPRTMAAVKQFQKQNELKPSGRLDSNTMAALGIQPRASTGGTNPNLRAPGQGLSENRSGAPAPGVGAAGAGTPGAAGASSPGTPGGAGSPGAGR